MAPGRMLYLKSMAACEAAIIDKAYWYIRVYSARELVESMEQREQEIVKYQWRDQDMKRKGERREGINHEVPSEKDCENDWHIVL